MLLAEDARYQLVGLTLAQNDGGRMNILGLYYGQISGQSRS